MSGSKLAPGVEPYLLLSSYQLCHCSEPALSERSESAAHPSQQSRQLSAIAGPQAEVDTRRQESLPDSPNVLVYARVLPMIGSPIAQLPPAVCLSLTHPSSAMSWQPLQTPRLKVSGRR